MRNGVPTAETTSPVTDLVRQIMRVLDMDGQWHGLFTDSYSVYAARSAGRIAGRKLNVPVYTTERAYDEQTTKVGVFVRRAPLPTQTAPDGPNGHET